MERIIVSFVVIAILSGCSQAPLIVFYNNADKPIVVSTYNQNVTIGAHQHQEIEPPTLKEMLRIEFDKQIFEYATVSPPSDYYESGFPRNRLYFQFETGAHIFVLRPGTKFPAEMFPEQPPKYPLKPINR